MDRTRLKTQWLDVIEARIRQRLDSLRIYFETWNGSESGFEDWVKVEFVAAIADMVSDVKGSGSGLQRPDLRVVLHSGEEVAVEIKGSTNWAPTHGNPWDWYTGKLLFFVCGSEATLESQRLAEVREQDASAGFLKLLEVSRPERRVKYAVLLGVVDVPSLVGE
jgi:hypothetical protein